jgi:hypothetical protein
VRACTKKMVVGETVCLVLAFVRHSLFNVLLKSHVTFHANGLHKLFFVLHKMQDKQRHYANSLCLSDIEELPQLSLSIFKTLSYARAFRPLRLVSNCLLYTIQLKYYLNGHGCRNLKVNSNSRATKLDIHSQSNVRRPSCEE